MGKKFKTSLFIFRRDLRVEDNTGLIFALENSERVICGFIFTPEQIDHNPYKSDHCLQFMIECLKDLEEQLKQREGHIYFFKGSPEKVVSKCIEELSIGAVVVNRDYTPYSRARDEKIEKVCRAKKVDFLSFNDALLHPPEETVKQNNEPYTVFTPFFKSASKQKPETPKKNLKTNYYQKPIEFAEKRSILSEVAPGKRVAHALVGGRSAALKIIKGIVHFGPYENQRNFPAENFSTHLSPYLKFTVLSPREVYAAIAHQLGPHHELIRALYWRDFFTAIAWFFPHVFGGAFHKKFDALKWSNDRQDFERWCRGMTGFPIVDAGMREMNETGFMHNRARMIVASFLVKDLRIDWRWGEKYFAQTLIDYDPAVNNGNWQWSASTGCDAQPYFRIFNPWSQQEKFDPDCTYIKKWVPELRDLTPEVIHSWLERENRDESIDYPAPMVDHSKASKETLAAYKAI